MYYIVLTNSKIPKFCHLGKGGSANTKALGKISAQLSPVFYYAYSSWIKEKTAKKRYYL